MIRWVVMNTRKTTIRTLAVMAIGVSMLVLVVGSVSAIRSANPTWGEACSNLPPDAENRDIFPWSPDTENEGEESNIAYNFELIEEV